MHIKVELLITLKYLKQRKFKKSLLSDTPNIFQIFLILSRPPIENLWCKNHENHRHRKSYTWEPLLERLVDLNL